MIAKPDITVIMPVRNGEKYLRIALQSIIQQDYPGFEVIVANDGSTDDTARIVAEFAAVDKRVRLLDAAESGFASVLNQAMKEARGSYIARLDADDEMLVNRLGEQHRALEGQPDLSLVASHVYYIDPNGKRRGVGGSSYHSPEEIATAAERELVVGFQHPSVMFRKEAVLSLGGYRTGMWPVEDVDLWTRMVEAGHRLAVMPVPLTNYRIHPSAGSRTFDSIRRLDWIKRCAEHRRQGKPEPSWEGFIAEMSSAGLFARISYIRRALGKYFYRRASQNWLIGNRLRGCTAMGAAFLLAPSHVRKRMSKFRRK